jgi:hypothetical protein
MRSLKIAVICVLLAEVCVAVVTHETITYKPPIKRISGRVVGFGNVNPGVSIQVFDKPEVWADDSLSFNQKRKRQKEIASMVADSNGKFEFHHIPKGAYEVQFSNKNGWNILSVLVVVEPSGPRESLCV